MLISNTVGKFYNDKPLSHCKLCGKKLELTNEFDTCSECQAKEIKVIDTTSNQNLKLESELNE